MRRIIYAITLALMLCCMSFSAEFPKPVGHVNDFAHMLSAGAAAELEKKLVDFESSTTTEIAVVTVDSLNGEDVENYANRLFREWGVGQKEKNNGVLFLFTKTDRRTRIEVGRGLEGALPDAICKRILRNDVRPSFKDGKFDEGTNAAVASIMKAVRGEYTAVDRPNQQAENSLPDWPWWIWSIIIVIVIVIVVVIISNIDNYSGGGSSWGGGDWGGSSSSDSDSSFGGFGGGDSGGGGASDSY